jgi:ribosomal protein L7/L12
MPSLGLLELLVILAVVVVIVAVVGVIIIMAVRRGNRAPVPLARPATPQELQRIVTQLARRGRQIHAIKELRQYTGLDLRSSKAVVDGVAMGHDMWSHPVMARFRPTEDVALPRTAGPDLATRVRELKVAGRAEQAVHLVRGETGMGDREAQLFVDSV